MIDARAYVPLVACLLSLVACGRGEIEESQRSWLVEQHALEKRLIDVRRAYDTQRRSIDRSRAADVAAKSRAGFDGVDSILRGHRTRLDRIDSTIERHSLAREVAIRADDEAAVSQAWESARRDYATASAVIDTIVARQRSLPAAIAAIEYRDDAADRDPATRDTAPTNEGDRVRPDRPR